MSGWIKVEKDLATDPRVLRMASRLRDADVTLGSRSRIVIVGALVTLWWYADTHIAENDVLPIGADQINELVGIENFCDLMPPEWLQVLDSNSVKLVDYTTHNGTTAKRRALGQRRQARHRNGVTLTSRKHNANGVTRPRPREDQDKNPPTPLGLDVKAWEEWLAYKQASAHKLKPVSIPHAQRELAKYGSQQSAVVSNSIAHGYQGLFAPKNIPAAKAVQMNPDGTVAMFAGKPVEW